MLNFGKFLYFRQYLDDDMIFNSIRYREILNKLLAISVEIYNIQ